MIRYFKETIDKGTWYHTVHFDGSGTPEWMRSYFPDTVQRAFRSHRTDPIDIDWYLSRENYLEVSTEEFEEGYRKYIAKECKALSIGFKATESTHATHDFVERFDHVARIGGDKQKEKTFLKAGLRLLRDMAKSLGLPAVVMIDDAYVDDRLGNES